LKKIKLLYILHDIQVGGVEVALVSAIPTLMINFDLRIVVLGKIDPKMVRHLSDKEQPCFHSFDYPLLSYPLAIFRIIWYILGERPDIIVCSLWRASLAGVIAKKLNPKLRFVSFIHSTTFFHKLDEFFTKAAIRNSDYIFVDSDATSHFVRSTYQQAPPTSVISFFIEKSPRYKINMPLSSREIRFISLGRICKVKNLPLALEAISYLRSRCLNVHLDLYGRDDGMLKQILQLITANNLQPFVKYRGELNADQKRKVFSENHFLIQLSSNEGMAMSVVEAMQNGLVCFVTPVGEISNYAEDMRTAVFANIWHKKEWQKSLEKVENVIRDPVLYENISRNSFQHFQSVKTYSESLSEAVLNIFEKPEMHQLRT
jgi:glycosyltransferase involved in cell wall biosynthesis